MRRQRIIAALLLALLLNGCATLPNGPSVTVLPAQGKPFDLFQKEDTQCRHWAAQQIGMTPDEIAKQDTTTGALVGTGIGAGLGALIGSASGNAGAGAAVGGLSGLLIGSAAGSDQGRLTGREAQQRYDTAYMQCMYAHGNQVVAPSYDGYGRRIIVVPPRRSYYPATPYQPPPPPLP